MVLAPGTQGSGEGLGPLITAAGQMALRAQGMGQVVAGGERFGVLVTENPPGDLENPLFVGAGTVQIALVF